MSEETKKTTAPAKAEVMVFKGRLKHNGTVYEAGAECKKGDPNYDHFRREGYIVRYEDYVATNARRRTSGSLQ